MHRWFMTAVVLWTLWATVSQAETPLGFPDPTFAAVIEYYAGLADAGIYEDDSFTRYWTHRLEPVWAVLPEEQQTFYLHILTHYDGIFKDRSARIWSAEEMRELLQWSLDPTQAPDVFKANLAQVNKYLTRRHEKLRQEPHRR